MRNVGEALCNLANKHKNLVLLHSDSSGEWEISSFVSQFGERSFNFGLAEQAMVSAAAGFSVRGKMPFVAGFATFLAGRSYEQIRNTICKQNLNVKFLGLADDFEEDVKLMELIPNMKVYEPKTEAEAARVMEEIVMEYGPAYVRACI